METRLQLWVIFGLLVPFLLAFDLLILHRRAQVLSIRAAAITMAFWVGVGLTFAGTVAGFLGIYKGMEFLTAYLVEFSLSIDNIFVFVVIFDYFSVPPEAHYRVLYLGILGAIIFRGIFIFAGIELLERASWAFFLFGALLLYSAARLLRHKDGERNLDQIWSVRLARRFLHMTESYHGASFFVRRGGKLMVTPLFLTLIAVESIDILFAADSVPAVLGISRDRLIAYSSNFFAILGLRALYFLLAALLIRLIYLRHGLALILGFIAIKFLTEPFGIKISTSLSLAIVTAILGLAVLVSLLRAEQGKGKG